MSAHKHEMSQKYIYKFIFRFIVFLAALLIYLFDRRQFTLLLEDFFGSFTLLHVIWAAVIVEMVMQAVPLRSMPSGCMKQFRFRFRPAVEGLRLSSVPRNDAERLLQQELRAYRRTQNLRAFVTLLAWFAANSFWFILYRTEHITSAECLMGALLYTVFDLICILVICPFQLFFMDTKCCSTCRIFNYGQIFLCTPLIGVGGFAAVSLCLIAVVIFLRWEYCFWRYPERFFEKTNLCLQCSGCAEQLCYTRRRAYARLKIAHTNGHFIWKVSELFPRNRRGKS